jgi:hypothetical protein
MADSSGDEKEKKGGKVQEHILEFIEAGFEWLGEKSPKFQVIKGNQGYRYAEDILLDTPVDEWRRSFTYFPEASTARILRKGE